MLTILQSYRSKYAPCRGCYESCRVPARAFRLVVGLVRAHAPSITSKVTLHVLGKPQPSPAKTRVQKHATLEGCVETESIIPQFA
jgi:hypothetical protein